MLSIRLYLIGAFCLAGLSACVSTSRPPQKSNLTAGVVQTSIKEGVTSQTEILRLLGAPNIVTRNKSNEVVWTYSRQSFDAESGAVAGGLLFFAGGQAFSSSASASVDLIITFDKRNIVKTYSFVSSQF